MKRLLAVCLAITSLHAAARADNWPQWRGPTNDGICKETNLPAEWSETKNVVWKLPMPGMAGSTPAIWGERIFLTSEDGNVLLFNAHVSSAPARPIEYPDGPQGLPDDYSKLLFRMSSILPEKLLAAARNEGIMVTPKSRGFVFNADLVAVIRFMDIGTKVAATVR